MSQPCLGAPVRYLNFVADSVYDLLASHEVSTRISQVESAVQLRARELGPHVLIARAVRDFRAYCLNPEILGRVGDCLPGSLRERLFATSLHSFDVVGRGAIKGLDYFEILQAVTASQFDPSTPISSEPPHLRKRIPITVRHELMPAMGVQSVAFSFDTRYLREWRQLDVTSRFDLVCRFRRRLIAEARRLGPRLEVVQIGTPGGRTFPLFEGMTGLGEHFDGFFSVPTPHVSRLRQLEVTVWRFQWLGAALCFCLTIGTLWVVNRSEPTAPSEI